MFMSAAEMKIELLQVIEQADAKLLHLMHAVAQAYIAPSEEEEITDEQIMAIPPSPDWKPMTKTELLAEIEEANAQIERGEYVTLEELEKEMEQW
jgi:hypothetical protein